jgi:hypothetical protein
MIDALLRLFEDGTDCCQFYQTIISRSQDYSDGDSSKDDQHHGNLPLDILSVEDPIQGLNYSQSAAVHSCKGPLSLIWGPPGLILLPTHRQIVDVQINR